MSDDYSPKRLPCRVHSTFEIAEPLKELPPDPEIISQSPETIRRKLTAVNDLLANATCEEGISMDSIATYIPPKAVREAAKNAKLKAADIEVAASKAAKKAAKIAALEAQLEALRRESGDDDSDDTLEKSTIARFALIGVDAVTDEKSEADGREGASVHSQVTQPPFSAPRQSLPSNDAVFVAPPAIGALISAPPAMGALMAAPPAIGALVVAALQPAARSPSPDEPGKGPFTDDFQLIHNEYKEALAMEKAKKHR